MLKVISNIMAHWYDLWNSIVNVINFWNAKKWFVYGFLS